MRQQQLDGRWLATRPVRCDGRQAAAWRITIQWGHPLLIVSCSRSSAFALACVCCKSPPSSNQTSDVALRQPPLAVLCERRLCPHMSASGGLPALPVHAMDLEDAIATFEAVTGGSRSVALHLLDAYGGDVNSAVAYYLESGGVGHGTGVQGLPDSPPDLEELPEALEEQEQEEAQPARPGNNRAAAYQPESSSPIEVRAGDGGAAAGGRRQVFKVFETTVHSLLQILDEDDDDGIQVLATSLGRRRAAQRMDDLAAGGCWACTLRGGAGWAACPPSPAGDGLGGVRGRPIDRVAVLPGEGGRTDPLPLAALGLAPTGCCRGGRGGGRHAARGQRRRFAGG